MAKLTQTREFKRLIELGSESGVLTYSQFTEILPESALSREKLELLFEYLKEKHQIEVVDVPSNAGKGVGRPALRKPVARDERSVNDAYGKTNDPVRMYLRKMGSVSLLTREGEIEIAKRIEEGELEVIGVLLETDFAVDYILAYEEKVLAGEQNVRDLVKDLEGADGSGEIEDDVLRDATLSVFERARALSDAIKALRPLIKAEQTGSEALAEMKATIHYSVSSS